MPVKVSHNIELGPDLPNEVMDVARKQGENPERVCADIQELRDMIFGTEKKENNFVYVYIKSAGHFYCYNFFFSPLIHFAQKEVFVCHHGRTMIFSFDFCVPDTLSSNMHTIWFVSLLFLNRISNFEMFSLKMRINRKKKIPNWKRHGPKII